nr:DpnII family type II restriction endonuclease [Helicobacter suis]
MLSSGHIHNLEDFIFGIEVGLDRRVKIAVAY